MFETGRRNVKRRTECLSDVFLHVFAEERMHILHKFIENPLPIVSFTRRRTTKLKDTKFLKLSKREG